MDKRENCNSLRILLIGLTICLLGKSCLSGIPAALAADADTSNAHNQSHPLLLKPGEPLVAGMKTEDIVATYDVNLAKEQVAAYSDSPEASFVLAVALTRTSMVEDALQEVRRARRLAEKQGGPAYFDHMIVAYEDMLKSYPKDNRVRYGLAWAYYMKAYVLTHYARSVMSANHPSVKPGNTFTQSAQTDNAVAELQPNWHDTWVKSLVQSPSATNNGSSSLTTKANGSSTASATVSINTNNNRSDPFAELPPELIPQIKGYYQAALHNLDQLLDQEPGDMWARSYRAFLYAEYTGDLQQAMDVWKTCSTMAATNPAAYFFLGQGYLKQGNLKECLHNISKAVALRGTPLQ